MRARTLLLALALVCGLLGESLAQRPTLTISDGGSSKSYSQQELLGRGDVQEVAVSDPVYGKPLTYRAVAAADLLKGLQVAPDAFVQTRATDNFSIGIPARALLSTDPARSQAFVAIENPAVPWPNLPGRKKGSAGPFYLVWRVAPGAPVSSEWWAYHLAALSVTSGPLERWPALRVGPEVPANDPIRVGLERYLELCIACHRFKGAGEGGQGPDLGMPMNAAQYFQLPALRKLIRDPASVRHWPEMKMPGFDTARLSDGDLDAIVAWLAYKARQQP